VAQEVGGLFGDVRGEQHADVAVRQHDVIREPGDQCFANRNGTVVLLAAVRK
jgi:hypothetical protein